MDPGMLAMLLAHGAGAGEAHGPMPPMPLQALTGHMGAPPPARPDNGLEEVQDAIQALHEAIQAVPDPGHVQMLTQALAILARVQRELMQPQTGPAGGQAAGQLRAQRGA